MTPLAKAVLATVVAVSGLLTLFFLLGDTSMLGAEESKAPNGYTYQPLGHRALREVLEACQHTVLVSRDGSGHKAGDAGILVVAQPDLGETPDVATDLFEGADRAILVLPKWRSVIASHENRYRLMDETDVNAVLHAFGLDGNVARANAPIPAASGLSLSPEIRRAPQWIVGSDLRPWIESEAGVLAGTCFIESTQVLVITDPDVISNHGIVQGGNARLVIEMIARHLGHSEPALVVLDEVCHGYARSNTLTARLSEFPLALVPIQGLIVIVLMVWMTSVRFGRPIRDEEGIAPGKQTLVENVADLRRYSGGSARGLHRYLASARREVAATLGLGGLEEEELLARLFQLEEVRQVSDRYQDVAAQTARVARRSASERAVILTARRIDGWRKEMLHVPGTAE